MSTPKASGLRDFLPGGQFYTEPDTVKEAQSARSQATMAALLALAPAEPAETWSERFWAAVCKLDVKKPA